MFDSAGDAPGEDPCMLGSARELAAMPSQAIGKIQTMTGSVTVTRAGGVVVQGKLGDLLYQGDVIETAADGVVAIIFRDGTAFNLSAGARMVLDEFVCDPNGTSNSARFNVGQGIFAFIAGKVAKAGRLSIDTPVAKIRSAAQGGGTGIVTLAALTFAVIDELQAHSPFAFLDDDLITYKDLPHGIVEVVINAGANAGQRILVDDPGIMTVVDSAGTVTRIALTGSRVAELQQLAHAVSLLSQDPAAPGSSGPSSNGGTSDFLRLLPINFEPPSALGSQTITPYVSPFIETPLPAPILPHIPVTGTTTEGTPTLVTGTLAALGVVQTAGPDGLLGTFDDVFTSTTFSLSSDTSGLPKLMAGGTLVSYSVAGNVLTASAGGETVFTLTVAPDGSFSFELFRQLDHIDDGTNSANAALRVPGGSVNSIDFSSIILTGGTPLGSGFFSVTVVDATPTVSANATALLDDDALTGGNPGGTGDDPDAVNVTGTLAHSYGADGAGTTLLTAVGAVLPADFTASVNPDGTILTIRQTSTGLDVLRVSLTNLTDGSYTVTQLHAIDHPDGLAENNLTFTVNYVTTDRDGDEATGSLSINVDDDAPTATAEASQNVAEGATITGTFDFASGADGATVTRINGTALVFGSDGYSQPIDIGDGSIKVKADGSYSFTADNPVVGTGAASATFTVTDGDGDTATANVSFQVIDANTPTSGTASAEVDDDGLNGGNPASVTGDLAVPNSDGDNNEATFTGVLGGSVGLDVPGTFSFAALNGTTGTVGTETVSYSWNSGTNTLTATGPRGALFTVAVTNPATGAYKVTLVDNVLQAQGPNGENDATTALTYTITDADGSSTTGTLNITFDDDAPTVSENATALLDDDALTGGIPGGTGDDTDSSNVSGTLGHSFGADGGSIAFLTSGAPAGFSYELSGNNLLVKQGTTTVVTVTLNTATGAYTVTQNAPIDHDLLPAGENNQAFTVNYRVTDGDGDTAGGTLAINVDDDTPTVSTNATVLLDDDALTGGNPGGTDDDVDSANVSGTLGHSFGADGGSVAFLTSGAPAGFSYELSGSTLLVKQGTTTVLTVTLNTATGAYTVTQNAPIVHAAGSDENNQAFTLTYRVTDGDGDTVDGTLGINVDDDTPSGLTPEALPNVENNGIAGTSDQITAALNFDRLAGPFSVGADGVGSVVFNVPGVPVGVTSGITVAATDLDGHLLYPRRPAALSLLRRRRRDGYHNSGGKNADGHSRLYHRHRSADRHLHF